MSEVHRYSVVKMLSEAGNKISYDPHGPEVVLASNYDALAQQPAPAVPDGWRLVPVEPTEEMLDAGLDRHLPQTMSSARLALLYRAMLTGVSAAPVVVQEPVAWQQMAVNAHALLQRVAESGYDDDCVDAVGDWLHDQPVPPAAAQPHPLEQFTDACGRLHSACDKVRAKLSEIEADEQSYSTTSDKYRAELYDEVREKARGMGYGNVTNALVALERMKAAEQPDAVKVDRELLRELARIFEAFAHSDLVPNDLSQQAAAALIATRATLAGGDK